MKREDLHSYRRTRTEKPASFQSYIARSASNPYFIYPLCHFIQIGLVCLILLGIFIFHSSAESQEVQLFYDHLQQQISGKITLTSGEWSGSLKDIFSIQN